MVDEKKKKIEPKTPAETAKPLEAFQPLSTEELQARQFKAPARPTTFTPRQTVKNPDGTFTLTQSGQSATLSADEYKQLIEQETQGFPDVSPANVSRVGDIRRLGQTSRQQLPIQGNIEANIEALTRLLADLPDEPFVEGFGVTKDVALTTIKEIGTRAATGAVGGAGVGLLGGPALSLIHI